MGIELLEACLAVLIGGLLLSGLLLFAIVKVSGRDMPEAEADVEREQPSLRDRWRAMVGCPRRRS